MAVGYPLTGALAFGLALLIFIAGWGYGRSLVPDRIQCSATRTLTALAIGTGGLGYTAFAFGYAGLLRPGALLAVLAAGVMLAVAGWVRSRGRPAARSPVVGDPGPGRLRTHRLLPPGLPRWSAVIAATAVGFGLLGGFLPEVEYDALWYHLTFPLQHLRSGRLVDLPCEHMSTVPQHVEMLFAYALLTEDARAAKFVHAGFGLLAAVWTALVAARFVGTRWAVVAGAFVVTTPTLLWEMTTAYNDLALTFLGIGAIALVLQWRLDGERSILILAAVLLGLGLAGKHLGYLLLAPLMAVVLLVPLVARRRSPADRIADAALFAGIAIAMAVPWYIRAWILTGNPLFPMFYELFSAAGMEIARWDAQAQSGWTAAMERYGHGRSPAALLLLPWRVTWNGGSYAGSLGPLWLLVLPLLVLFPGRIDPDLRVLTAIALAYLAIWMSPYSSFQVRYLLPLVPVLSILAVAALRNLRAMSRHAGWRRAPTLLSGLVAAVLVTNLPPLFLPLADAREWTPSIIRFVKPSAWATALGLYDVDRYIADRVRPYGAVQYMNRTVADDASAVNFSVAAHFYARSVLISDYSRCVVAGTWNAGPGQESRAYAALRHAGITHIIWDRTRRDVADDLAIATDAFRTRYTQSVYEDQWVRLYELTEDGGTTRPHRP